MNERPLVVGIVNCTPDSFYDGGRHQGALVAYARALHQQGADWIDVGGESTRPGAPQVDAEEELRRILPVIRALRDEVPISVDTSKPAVARAALAAGARILNDVHGLDDPELAAMSRDAEATVVMHMRGTPATMRSLVDYDDVVSQVRESLLESAARSHSPVTWIDPGIGFAKTSAQSLLLLQRLPAFVETGFPVFVGASRKSFIGATLGQPDPKERLPGSLAAVSAAIHGGARAVRVHDVAETRQFVDLLHAVGQAR